MKKARSIALLLIAALILPYNVKSAEMNNPSVADGPLESAETASQSSANVPIKLPNANPVHKIDLTSGKIKILYPDGKVVEHEKKYIPLIINGTLIDSDVILVNNRTLVPLRVLTEALGGTVEWHGETKTVTINKGFDVIKMEMGNKTVIINNEKHTIDEPPNLYNDYAYLPLRFVSETLGAKVSYNTGEYDPSTMRFNSYMLVQGVSGNAVVDQYDPSWPVLSEFQAETTIMNLSRDLFTQFMAKNNADNPGKNFSSKYNFILSNIDNTRYIGSVSRYYVIESFSLFLFDKYSGEVYTVGSDSKSNWVRRYQENDPQNFEIFTKAYLIG